MKVTNPPNSPPAPISEKAVEKLAPKAASKGSPVSHSPSPGVAPVEISDNARMAQKALELIQGLPEGSQEKIQALKKSIREGNYRVDADALAERILQEHLSTNFGKNNL